ncbi:MAG: hypothetical protein PHU12_02080 [Candidatus Aenigmarchaeota archaeon]|nr:hypothetical protein [Candidatus Aenigmarchaeota archaeon]
MESVHNSSEPGEDAQEYLKQLLDLAREKCVFDYQILENVGKNLSKLHADPNTEQEYKDSLEKTKSTCKEAMWWIFSNGNYEQFARFMKKIPITLTDEDMIGNIIDYIRFYTKSKGESVIEYAKAYCDDKRHEISEFEKVKSRRDAAIERAHVAGWETPESRKLHVEALNENLIYNATIAFTNPEFKKKRVEALEHHLKSIEVGDDPVQDLIELTELIGGEPRYLYGEPLLFPEIRDAERRIAEIPCGQEMSAKAKILYQEHRDALNRAFES